jgi:hypothetical protein
MNWKIDLTISTKSSPTDAEFPLEETRAQSARRRTGEPGRRGRGPGARLIFMRTGYRPGGKRKIPCRVKMQGKSE